MIFKRKPKLTKEQQDNVVKRIARGYDIHSVGFTKFSQDGKTGSYHLLFTIDNKEKYQTGVSIRNLEELNNSHDEIVLNPIEDFEDLEREQEIPASSVNMKDISIKYLGE